MKKNLWILIAVSMAVFLGTSWLLWAETVEKTQAGVAVSVKGEVKATTPPDKTAHALKSGDKVFMGDKIETGADGQLQILLLDETVFTLGPVSAITVDEFLYDPAKGNGNAGVVKGVFRAVTGKVTQKKQEDAAGVESLLSTEDDLGQKSREAAQDNARSPAGSASR